MDSDQTDEDGAISQRSGQPMRHRTAMPDGYGLLLVLVLAAIVSATFAEGPAWVRPIPVLVEGGMLIYAQRTSQASGRLRSVTAGFVGVAVLIAVFVAGPDSARRGTAYVVAVLLVAATAVVVGRRLLQHRVITGRTILGALSIYLLLGLLFAHVFAALDAFGGEAFFAGLPDATETDYLYFSYVTQTTVGYGDLVPAQRLGQLVAVCEALIGQLYLVTVVALAVSRANLSRRRR